MSNDKVDISYRPFINNVQLMLYHPKSQFQRIKLYLNVNTEFKKRYINYPKVFKI